jgi:hypothetical protein
MAKNMVQVVEPHIDSDILIGSNVDPDCKL